MARTEILSKIIEKQLIFLSFCNLLWHSKIFVTKCRTKLLKLSTFKWIIATKIWLWMDKDDLCLHNVQINTWWLIPSQGPIINTEESRFWYNLQVYHRYWINLHGRTYITWFKFMYKWAIKEFSIRVFEELLTRRICWNHEVGLET